MPRQHATLGATRRACSGAGMAHWRDRFLGIGELPPELSIFELEFFQFSPQDVAAIRKEFRPKYCIAVALQLGFMRMTGARLNAFNVVPRKLLNLVWRAGRGDCSQHRVTSLHVPARQYSP
jgi:hypothetical protein